MRSNISTFSLTSLPVLSKSSIQFVHLHIFIELVQILYGDTSLGTKAEDGGQPKEKYPRAEAADCFFAHLLLFFTRDEKAALGNLFQDDEDKS